MEQTNNKLIKLAALSSVIDTAYAAANLFVGITEISWWFIMTGVYYLILSATRFTIVIIKKNQRKSFFPKFAGCMLMSTALPLLGIAILCSVNDMGNNFHEILMIGIAAYAFSKITLAIINLVKSRKHKNSLESSLKSISLSTALVSIASLQRSMLISFGTINTNEIRLFNVLTSTGVSIIVFIVGLFLFRSSQKKNSPTSF